MRTSRQRSLKLLGAAALCAGAAWAAPGCILTMPDPDTEVYGCKTSADCAGDGFVCVARADSVTFCCRPEPEDCNGRDDDCNGKVDDVPEKPCYSGPEGTAGKGICEEGRRTCLDGKWSECYGEITPSTRENCNSKDDNCDGSTDEGFDFLSDEKNCGSCNNACPPEMWCANGKCSKDTESCNDQIDNDQDSFTDCTDSDCLGQGCKDSLSGYTCDAQKQCSCHGLLTPPAEATCDDHGDDDCDGLIDCLDSDCQDQGCGVGCVCKSLAMTETACDNLRDDDADGSTDCNDSDCAGASCGTGCACDGTKKAETDCTDGVDNDGDHQRDCVDADCLNKDCKTLSGASGKCAVNSSSGCQTPDAG